MITNTHNNDSEAWRPLIDEQNEALDKADESDTIFIPHPLNKASFISKFLFNWVSPIVTVSKILLYLI